MKKEPSVTLRSGRVLGRRGLLGAALVAAPLAAVLSGCSTEDGDDGASPFRHGVASGDPLPDGIILWTRVTGDEGPVEVTWEIAMDESFAEPLQTGVVTASAERDHTVKVDVRGLAPGSTYHYRFRAAGRTSPVGRTKTAPAGPVDRLRIGMVSCASYAHGYFHAYRALAEQGDLDVVLHLGDYVYEYADGDYGDLRGYEPSHECLTLADYRARHGHYKKEPELQAVHRRHPFIPIWDDHETANDSSVDGAQNHSAEEGSWPERREAGKRAYFEWMPIRETEPGRIRRSFAFGDLVDLVMLDTRLEARTRSPEKFFGEPPPPDPTRTLLGDAQATWMEDTLRASTARWKLLGQQVMVSTIRLDEKQIVNLDQWHGYPESRHRLFEFLRTARPENLVVLTGDIHSSWAMELVEDPQDAAAYDPATGRGALGVEFVTPGVASPGIPDALVGIVDSALPQNPHVKWIDPSQRGYVVLDVTRERLQAAWFFVDDVTKADDAKVAFARAYRVDAGTSRLVQDDAPAAARV